MLLCDNEIKDLNAIEPFVADQTGKEEGKISYGLSSFGYDIRLAPEFLVLTHRKGDNGATLVDPKDFPKTALVAQAGEECIIPPNSFALARSLEYITMPQDCLAICMGKSTYARCGIVLNTTPLEPGWEGHITLEISNTTPYPAKVYANEGIAQLLFFKGHTPLVSYSDRKGKYQGQNGIVLPK